MMRFRYLFASLALYGALVGTWALFDVGLIMRSMIQEQLTPSSPSKPRRIHT